MKTQTLNRRPVKNERIIAWRTMNGQTIVINLREESFNVLNVVATRIWQLIDGMNRIKDILRKIYIEFEVEEDVLLKDCSDFLEQMERKGLIIFSQPRRKKDSEPNREGILFDELREEAIRRRIPLVGHFDISYRCNLNCVHCYIVPQKSRQELTTEEIKNILEQLARAGTIYLTLSGGEVLTRKDFFEIASYARELNFSLRVLTNGTLIDKEVANRIAVLCPELVAVSIYGADPMVHDKVTGIAGSFRRSVSALKMLIARGLRVKISTVIMEQNISQWHAIYELSRRMGAYFQADYRITPKSNGDRRPLMFHISDKDLPALLSDSIFTKTKKEEFDSQEFETKIFDIVPCGAGHMSFYISPYGDVNPCVQLPINCGSLRKNSFEEIWERSSQIQSLRKITISQLPVCCQCKNFRYCRICIGLNYVENGNAFYPSQRVCKEATILERFGLERR
ncbi:MAG: PqqD family peptide modification chaperone [Candidatus Pacebacteria bacterium]|nr:PqqD family peptide modification chaperone [Candidatus Paceibacterota bacterium]